MEIRFVTSFVSNIAPTETIEEVWHDVMDSLYLVPGRVLIRRGRLPVVDCHKEAAEWTLFPCC